MKTISGRQTIAETLPDLLHDESRFTSGIPDAVYFPRTALDVRQAVLDARRNAQPITVIGGKTGITGGSVPIDGCIAICFSDMDRIHRVSREDDGSLVLHCDPGVTLAKLSEFLRDPQAWPAPVEGSALLGADQWLYAPDPTESTAQLGGTVATNASGARSFRFGATRAHVVRLSCVLASGETLELARGGCKARGGVLRATTDQNTALAVPVPSYRYPAVKNACGYYAAPDMDLIDLFIGSEGTLGIFTGVGVRLVKNPRFAAGLSFFPDRNAAFGAAAFLRAIARVSAIEYFDHTALRFLELSASELSFRVPQLPPDKRYAVYWEYMEAPGEAFDSRMDAWEAMLVSHGSSFESTWSGFDRNEIELLKAIRHAIPEAVNSAIARRKRDCADIRKISTDTALPAPVFEKEFGEYIDAITGSGLEHAVFGHLGDFHLHINLVPRNAGELAKAKELYEKMMDSTILHGGTVSAEHGIGKLKTAYLGRMFGQDAVEEMKRIKTAFDPQWLLNRGNLFEYDKRDLGR
jgi:D-lactate dehydrogenase (cytochrome)